MRRILVVVAAVLFSFSAGAEAAKVRPVEARPRLVVVVSVDQCRADYLARFADHFLPARRGRTVGGFRYLLDGGADYRDAHHVQVPTTTCVGHTSIATGAPPSLHGILGNVVYDRAEGRVRRCLDDPTTKTVGGRSLPASAAAIQATTVGDELELATGGLSRVVAISYKDRAAIPLGGHAADLVLWFDDVTGNWVSSTYYLPDGRLPAWVTALNEEKLPDRHLGQSWRPLLDREAYRGTQTARRAAAGSGPLFDHALPAKAGEPFYEAFVGSGTANDYLVETARRALVSEGLGRDEVPDLLLLNLATNDYVGHRHGPNSAEVVDVTVRTDRALSRLFDALEEVVPGGLRNVVVALTGDHAVSTAPEEGQEAGRLPGGRDPIAGVGRRVDAALDELYGAGDWVLAAEATRPNLYLDRKLMAERQLDPAAVELSAAQAAALSPGVYAAFGRSQIMSGQLPPVDYAQLVFNGFHRERGGDVFLVTRPGWSFGAGPEADHGSPWVPDTHVPLILRGPGVTPGVFHRRASALDLAPTLSQLLGIGYPSACQGRPLHEALDAPASAR